MHGALGNLTIYPVPISREKSRSAPICTRPKLILVAESPTSDISNTKG
jgi:hypothetical protein